jgi:hypothetical protein
MIQIGFYKHIVTLIDRPNTTTNPLLKVDKSQNEKIRNFITNVPDNNELLNRLAKTGFFD